MKKYWVAGACIYILGTTLNLSPGDKIFCNGSEATVISSITNP